MEPRTRPPIPPPPPRVRFAAPTAHPPRHAPHTHTNRGLFYVLVSTNFDRRGQAFVSTMEGWDYPIVGTQWHPERNAYEWRDLFSPEAHSPEAVAAMQYMATFFVTDARRNAQAFADPALFAH